MDDFFGVETTRAYAWLAKNFKVETVRELATAQRAGKVINVLKGMIERKEERRRA